MATWRGRGGTKLRSPAQPTLNRSAGFHFFFESWVYYAPSTCFFSGLGVLSLLDISSAKPNGTFTGQENTTSGIISFRGVRFADAPVGNLRWRAPVSPPSAHLGNVDATKFADICIQTTQQTPNAQSSEDCLFGNVNIPIGTKEADKLPVMVWFHGGGFQAGSTHDAPPEFLMGSSAEPLIFVSFEYRLGQFGFLVLRRRNSCRSDGALNAGLLDQRAALRWVQRYIPQFGGDPSRVTIWGESAGAGSTMFQLLGNGGDNEGLFRAAMGDSPSLNFPPLFNSAYDEGIFEQFATLAGCSIGQKVMPCLRAASSAALISAGSSTIGARTDTLFVFAPFVDGSFVKEQPVEAFRNGHFARVPVLFGSNTNEGAHWSASLPDGAANTSMPNATEQTVFNFIKGQYPSFTTESFNEAVSKHYPLGTFNGSFSLQGQQMYGEMRYICTAGLIAGAARAQGVRPSNSSKETRRRRGHQFVRSMREYWTSFVTSGVPTAKGAARWTTSTASVDGSPRMLLHPGGIAMERITDALDERCSFWHDLSAELGT
ncbi:Alpha/Beta hydrolase protein [Infundibulicybe gibba]|nr:Alpha/Beta hydrolase protein [Infundibulicybe gibba]